MTKEGLQLIKDFEGFRDKAYRDQVNIWTIGYGFTYYKDGTKVKQGDTITKEEAEELLYYMVEKNYGTYVDKYATRLKTSHQRDALISLAYNIGVENFRRSTLLKKVNINPDDPSIRNEFSKWCYAGGKRLPGLERRRKAEADLYFS